MLGRVVSYDVEVRSTTDIELRHPWWIVRHAKRVCDNPEDAAIDVMSECVPYSKEWIQQGMAQHGDDEGEGTWWLLVDKTMFSVQVTFESEAARMSFAVFELLKTWPYKNRWGPNAVSIFKAVAEAYGLEYDMLSLAFAEEWSVRFWVKDDADDRMGSAI